jgi:hypothetical protein
MRCTGCTPCSRTPRRAVEAPIGAHASQCLGALAARHLRSCRNELCLLTLRQYHADMIGDKPMNKLTFSAIVAATVAIGASTATAAPLRMAEPGIEAGVQLTHGRHRYCAGGPGWRHRHTWRGHRVPCYRYYRRHRPGVILRFGDRHRHHYRHYRHGRRHH